MKENGTGSGEVRGYGAAVWQEIRSADGLGESGAASLVELRLADLIAERVAAKLQGRGGAHAGELIDAHEVARILGCERGWVYEHQAELGAVRLGNGRRPRLRFDRARVEAIATYPG